jgi:Mn-dependent DtxR family transcriptional regulator
VEYTSRVREEEIDWCIYRLVADKDAMTVSEIITCTQLESSIVKSSLQRLIRARLIARVQDRLCLLSFQETLIHRQLQEDASPVYLEDGVIKVKFDREKTI